MIRHIVFIEHSLTSGLNFRRWIDVPFNPDEMIVRQVNYANPEVKDGDSWDDEPGVFVMDSSLVTGRIATWQSQITVTPQVTFSMHQRQVRGEYDFRIQRFNAPNSTPPAGYLCVILEFIRHRE